jgi:sodium transport system ATP-binding protein
LSIEVINLVRRFYDAQRGEFAAVNEVSFECRPGEVFGLLGPNGAGKSTILRIISTLLRPNDGTVKICGFDVRTDPEKSRSQLGFLSADTSLYRRLTAEETLRYFGTMSGVEPAHLKQRVDSLIDRFDIGSFAHVRCEKLSTGMKQRVSIARAIVHDPPVICLDEPTNGLDIIAILATQQFIRDFRDAGKCILFSTHNMHEAEKLCDRIAIIHHGKLVAIGTLEELRNKTGKHYLEDVFVDLVGEKFDEIV